MVNYEVDFKRREGVWTNTNRKVGVSYAVFNSGASVEDIGDIALEVAEDRARVEKEKSGIRDCSKLEIALASVADIKHSDNPALNYFLDNNDIHSTPSESGQKIPMRKLQYALQVARYGKTNKEMADYLDNVMREVHGRCDSDKPYTAAVVYKNPNDGFLDFRRD